MIPTSPDPNRHERVVVIPREMFAFFEERLQADERFVETNYLKENNAFNLVLYTPGSKKLILVQEPSKE